MTSQYEVKYAGGKIKAIIIGIILVAIITIILSAGIKIVDAGHRGILLHFQQIDGVQCDEKTGDCIAIKPPLKEGMHFVVPFQDDIVQMEVRTQKFEKTTGAGSKDLQGVSTTVAINYRVSPESANLLFATVGLDYTVRIITPAVDEVVKQITARYNAEELITKREIVKGEIVQALGQRLARFNLLQQEVSITDFQFSTQFSNAVDAKVTAEQNAKTAQNVVAIKEAEAQQAQAVAHGTQLAAIETAEGVKQAHILEAEGLAQAITIQAQANQEAIRLLTEMLRNNPEYIEYLRLLQWNGVLPDTLVITDSEGNNLLLQIPTKTIQQQPQE